MNHSSARIVPRAIGCAMLMLLVACASPATHAEAEAYIRAHIEELSPTPAVLGGTFTVTDIEWENADTAIVSYEDGHIALTGRTTIRVEGGGVTATELVLLDTDVGGGASSSVASGSGSVASAMERPRAHEGELCGGIAGIQCDFGLICQYEGAYPDAAGTCVQTL